MEFALLGLILLAIPFVLPIAAWVSASRLRGVMATTETNILSFLKSTDVYDPNRISADLELIRRYYLKNGYADFRIVSSDVQFDPNAGGYVVTIAVEEGPQYRVGAVNVDLTARVERAPVAGETDADGVLQRGPGGKGANQAVAAARLGAAVRLIGAVGDDADGRGIRDQLAAVGVDASGVQTAEASTGTALIVVDATGENSIVVCAGANAAIDATTLGTSEERLGLLGMRERVESLGGEFRVESRPGDGTRVVARLPRVSDGTEYEGEGTRYGGRSTRNEG